MESSISSIIKIEESKNSPVKEFESPSKKVDLRDRQGCDIFGWSNHTETSDSYGKKRNQEHAATSNNGNLT
jgi:hypothetical protein